MTKGLIRVLRLYCGFDAETISEVTGIALAKYKRIEAGEEIPSDKDIEKLASVFGVSEKFLRGDEDVADFFAFRQQIDENLFATEEQREQMKLRITELTPLEKKLILLIRCSENSEETILKTIENVIEDM